MYILCLLESTLGTICPHDFHQKNRIPSYCTESLMHCDMKPPFCLALAHQHPEGSMMPV